MSSQHLRVLLVEDDDLTASATTLSLEVAAGAKVTRAADADAARRMLAGPDGPDVVLLDLHLSGVADFDLVTQVASSRPCVVLSADVGRETPERVQEAGATMLRKPASLRQLLDALASASGRVEG